MNCSTILKRNRVMIIGLALSLLFVCQPISTPQAASMQGYVSVAGTYSASQNFWDSTLVINQSGTSIWGTLDDGGGPNYISGYVSSDPSGATTGITFTRYGPGFTQVYKGAIVVGRCFTVGCSAKLLYGTFDHNGTGTYGWYAAR